MVRTTTVDLPGDLGALRILYEPVAEGGSGGLVCLHGFRGPKGEWILNLALPPYVFPPEAVQNLRDKPEVMDDRPTIREGLQVLGVLPGPGLEPAHHQADTGH